MKNDNKTLVEKLTEVTMWVILLIIAIPVILAALGLSIRLFWLLAGVG